MPPTVVVVGSGPQAIAVVYALQRHGEAGADEVSVTWLSQDKLRIGGSPWTGLDFIDATKARLHTTRHEIRTVDAVVKNTVVCADGTTVPFDALILALDAATDGVQPPVVHRTAGAPRVANLNDDISCAALRAMVADCRPVPYYAIPQKVSRRGSGGSSSGATTATTALADSDDDAPDEDDAVLMQRPTCFALRLPRGGPGFEAFVAACCAANKTPCWPLADALRFPTVATVDVSDPPAAVGDDVVQCFAAVVRDHHHQPLPQLASDGPVPAIALLLDIRLLTLRNCGLTGACIAPLAAALLRSPDGAPVRSTLTHIDLSRNALGASAAELLRGIGGSGCELRHLALAGCGIGGDIAPHVGRLLSSTASLVSVDLSDNALGAESAAAVVHSARHAVTTLRLACTGMDDTAAPRLRELLKSSSAAPSRIAVLDLGRNALGDRAALALGESLMQSTAQSLSVLSLEGNGAISATGIEFLAKCFAALGPDAAIRELNVRGTGAIGVNTVLGVATLVERCPDVRTLSLSVQELEQQCVLALREALKAGGSGADLRIEVAPRPATAGGGPLKPSLVVDASVWTDIAAIAAKNRTKRGGIAAAAAAAGDKVTKPLPAAPTSSLGVAAACAALMGSVSPAAAFLSIVDDAAAVVPSGCAEDFLNHTRALLASSVPLPPNVRVTSGAPQFDQCATADVELLFMAPYTALVSRLTGLGRAAPIPVFGDFALKRADAAAISAASASTPIFAVGNCAAHPKLCPSGAADEGAAALSFCAFVAETAVVSALRRMQLARHHTDVPLSRHWLFQAFAAATATTTAAQDLGAQLTWNAATATPAAYARHFRLAEVLEEVLRALDQRRPERYVDLAALSADEIRAELQRRAAAVRDEAAAREKEKERLRAEAAKKAAKPAKGGKKGGEDTAVPLAKSAADDPDAAESPESPQGANGNTGGGAAAAGSAKTAHAADVLSFLIAQLERLQGSPTVTPPLLL